jgi:glycine oxidase
MHSEHDLIVIGGGIMGAATAWRCADAGLRVTLIDGPRTGHEASWAAAGMLAPSAEVEFHEEEIRALGEASQREWPAFAAALEEASGQSVGYDDRGTIMAAVDRDHGEALARLFAYQCDRGLPVERWSGAQCREREPLLAPRIHSGLWCPQDHQVDAWAATEAARTAARKAGVVFVEGARVTQVRVAAGEAAGVTLEDGRTIDAPRVLVAAGAWGRAIDGLGALSPPVRPVKGQAMALHTDPSLELAHVIRARHAYIVPKETQWVVGATSEERGFDARVTAGGLYQLLDGAWEAVPAVLELEVADSWTGFRPASRDGKPILGCCDVEGLYFCTGHYRHGIQLAAISTRTVAEVICGRPADHLIAPFSIHRFQA